MLYASLALSAQTPEPDISLSPVANSWPTYNGDYSGRRYSSLAQINQSNVHSLQLAWAFQTHAATLKSTPLQIGSILYFTVPDIVWAVDAKTGQKIWDFRRPSEGDHLGQRGVAYYNGRIYFGTPDAHLICLDARNGNKLWDVEIADVKFGYYLSIAPLIVKGRIILGTSGDEADVPHFIEARDWETGKLVWKTFALPQPGDPAAKTWPNEKSMSRGGGAMWITGTYDPDLNLLYWGSGNPHPVLAGVGRAGANLYTSCILALNPDTGAIVWSFQASPHDTHDWDAVETPVLFDADFHGKPRKLIAQASRNGYFFVLDRKTGENLLSQPYVKINFSKGVDAKGSPIPDPATEPQPDGALVEGAADGATNWMSPSYDPQTKLFYVNAQEGYGYWYLALGPNGLPEDHQGGGSQSLISTSVLLALDYQTGKVRWQRESGIGLGTPGILTTAGHLLFTGDISGNLLALDPENGTVLWHTRGGGSLSNAPMTYQLNGRQYVLTGVDGVLYAWSLPSN
ncbi:quinoprotein ethanol dehydrogenase [Edaphobacter acidisoli]|uniref:Quinoprotein ethanol dehydrogenase n=1 Tax=Edaphobacter acidisoli TaxID=2040573 RepID=A0A916RGJ2_9BACT|nr:acido-empty-quinoprotein group A [Edaphobacter acidisoli]GGA54927.1 quinoprotein ethanol dehydrogenase [Edaphobacter acidisoli]